MNVTVTELFLSSVLGKPVIDELGRDVGKLWDMVLEPGEVFPEVSQLLIKGKNGILAVPWKEIYLFNPFVISVARTRNTVGQFTSREGEILVRRDILDKQIVDVNGAKVVRVNDLKLGSYKDHLCIFFADVGFRGLLRRLGYEKIWGKFAALFNKSLPDNHISWEYVQPLEFNVSRLALTMARDQMAEMHPADIAHIISQIPSKNIQTVLTGAGASQPRDKPARQRTRLGHT
jgi:magnesium transporter